MRLKDSEMRSIDAWCHRVVDDLIHAEIGPFRKDFKNTICTVCTEILTTSEPPCNGFEYSLALEFLVRRLYEYFIRNQKKKLYEDDPEIFQREFSWFLIHTIDDSERKNTYWNFLIHQKKTTDSIASEKMLHYVKKTNIEQQLLLANEMLRTTKTILPERKKENATL